MRLGKGALMGKRKGRGNRDAQQPSVLLEQPKTTAVLNNWWLLAATVLLFVVAGILWSRAYRPTEKQADTTPQAEAQQSSSAHPTASLVQGLTPGSSAEPSTSCDLAAPKDEKKPDSEPPAPYTDSPDSATAEIAAFQKEAKAIATSLVESYPNNPSALRVLGLVYNAAGEKAKAAQCWEKALKLAPNRSDLYLLLATLAQLQGDYEKVADLCRSGVSKCPPTPHLYRTLGMALISLAKPDEAIAPLQKAAEMSPDDADVAQLLGKAYAALNQHEKAKQSYELAVKLQPGSMPAHYGLGMAYAKLGLEERSKQSFEKCQKLGAENVSEQRGIRGIRHALERERQNLSAACAEAAKVYNEEHRFDKAEALLRRAAAVLPTNPAFNIWLAMLLVNTGRPKDAIPVYREVIAIEPKNARHHAALAGIYGRLSQWNDAVSAAKEAVELEPANEEYRRILQQLQARR
jgi:tetratricopeptide (TPR) repeat protein